MQTIFQAGRLEASLADILMLIGTTIVFIGLTQTHEKEDGMTFFQPDSFVGPEGIQSLLSTKVRAVCCWSCRW